MEKLTMKNTKADILDAYKAAIKKAKESKVVSVKKENKAKEDASTLVDAFAIKVSDLNTVKNSIINDLSCIEHEMTQKREDLKKLAIAIDISNHQLEERYNIEAEVESLDALIQAQVNTKLKFEEAHSDHIKLAREELTALEEELKFKKNKLNQDQQRAQEEFKYNFNQEKQRSLNEIQQIKDKADNTIKEEWEKLTAAKDELHELRELKEAQPELIKKAKEKAIAITINGEKTKHEFEIKTLEDKLASEDKLFNTMIESLQAKVDELTDEKRLLANKLEAATLRVQEIADTAVKNAQPRIMSMPNGKTESMRQ